MSAALLPGNELARLAALRALNVLDSSPEPEFDALAQAAAMVCGVPIAMISLVDNDRQWFKATAGPVPMRETPRDIAFCAHAILQDDIFEVPDATQDARFADNALVTSSPDIRFYAGATLRLADGANVGTLCVLDAQPRQLDAQQRQVLGLLAKAAVKALESRLALQSLTDATHAAQQSEAKFRVLSEASPLGVFAADARVRATYTNARLQDILGLGAADCLGNGWTSVIPADEREQVRAAWRRTATCGTEYQFEHRVLRPDGRVRHIHVRARPISDSTQAVTGFVGSVDDVTERRQTLEQLAAGERRLRELYESTPAMLHSIDAQGCLLTVSDRWLRTLGYRREDVVGRPVWEFATDASREHLRNVELPCFFALGRSDEIEFSMRTKAGKVLDVRLSAILERDAEGRPLRGIAVTEDITERLRAERALHDERQRLAFTLDGTGAGTWEWHVPSGKARFNSAWAAMLGQTLDDLAPLSFKTFGERVHADDLARTTELLQAHFAGKTASFETEIRMKHRDGRWIWVLSRGRVMTWTSDGLPEWMFGTHLDLTARKQQEETLRKNAIFLNRTGSVAGVGGWEYDLPSDTLFWSDAVCLMHDRAPGYQPTLAEAMSGYTPESRERMQAATERALRDGLGWDLEVEVVTVTGRRLWVRNVAEIESEGGRPVRALGAFQDITALIEQRSALERANERLALATESGHIAIWEFDIHAGTITLDAMGCAAYGVPGPRATFTLAEWEARVHPDDRASARAAAQDAIAGQGQAGGEMDTEFRIVWPDGSIRHLRATGRVTRDANGQPQCLVGANWDVTPLRRLGAELAEQHELLRVTLQSIGDAVITTDAAGCVTWLNPSAERMTGWLTVEAAGRPLDQVFHIVHDETRHVAENPVAACLAQGRVSGLAHKTVLLSRNGAEFGIEDSAAPIRSARGTLLGAVLVFHDVTEQRRLASEMSYRAMHDALTGLVNRAEFEARLRRLLDKAQHDESAHALLYIDLDQFKLVNDACGHSVGDQLLQQVSRLLLESVRSRDTLARLGGDEFAILLEHCPAEQAERVAQKICDRMDDFRFVHDARRFRLGTSIGLVPIDRRWSSPATAMQAADTSCYAAKEAGRNRVHVWFDTDLAMQARHGEMKWASRLEQAVDEDRFVLFAQRITAIHPLRANHGVHAEALLRLVDTDGSLIAPGAFLPAAERFHLATRIDRWVLRHAVDWLVALADPGVIETLCVNLSGQSIGDRAFHRHAAQILGEAGHAVCQRICLEITETVAITNLSDAALFIEQARALGVQIALDDFGAGASSFGYLKTLAVDVLKIDGQFITDILDDPLDDAAVRCFVDVARVCGLKTVAEFVDCPEVLARLREIGVDYAQGYLLHRPEPIERLLDRQPERLIDRQPERLLDRQPERLQDRAPERLLDQSPARQSPSQVPSLSSAASS